MNKKILITILTILGLAIIIAGGFYLWSQKKAEVMQNNAEKQIVKQDEQRMEKEENRKKNGNDEKDKNDEKKINNLEMKNPEEIVKNFGDIFFRSSENIDTRVRKGSCFEWNRKDGIIFGPANSWAVLSVRSDISSIERNIKQIKNLLINNGFRESKLNQGNYILVLGIKGEKKGFEKNKIKCNIIWLELTSDKDSNKKYRFEFSCTKMDAEAEEDFKKFSIALKEYVPPIKEYSKITNVKKICITRKDNDFAKGSVGVMSAPTWYAKKENGKWVVTLVTQDYPLCSSITSFPKDYYGGKCFFEDGTIIDK